MPSETEMTADRVAIRDDLLTTPLDDLSAVRLVGTRCADCNQVSLGRSEICPNCGGTRLETGPLSARGTLWTYTVIRNKPPGDYRGPDPFEPFCMGLVELPDGLRVNAVVDAPVDTVEIGMTLRLKAFVHHRNDAGQQVVGFCFVPDAPSP